MEKVVPAEDCYRLRVDSCQKTDSKFRSSYHSKNLWKQWKIPSAGVIHTVVFFHNSWSSRRNTIFILFTSSTCSLIFTHLFGTLLLRWLPYPFNRSTCYYLASTKVADTGSYRSCTLPNKNVSMCHWRTVVNRLLLTIALIYIINETTRSFNIVRF